MFNPSYGPVGKHLSKNGRKRVTQIEIFTENQHRNFSFSHRKRSKRGEFKGLKKGGKTYQFQFGVTKQVERFLRCSVLRKAFSEVIFFLVFCVFSFKSLLRTIKLS